MRRALMLLNLYGHEAVWHKLKNRQKMHFLCVFRPFLSLCWTASRLYRLSHINVLFASSPWKLVTNFVLEWMGLNFYDYDGLQPKITTPKHFRRQCRVENSSREGYQKLPQKTRLKICQFIIYYARSLVHSSKQTTDQASDVPSIIIFS